MTVDLLAAGQRWHQSGDFPRAEEVYRRLLQCDPGNVLAWYFLGVACLQQRKLPEAEALFRRALHLRADFAEAHNNLGLILRAQQRTAEAAVSFRAAVHFQPQLAEAHNNLGTLLSRQNRLDEAIHHLLCALHLKPGCAEAHSNLGGALWRLGRLEEAVVHLREALRLQPQSVEALNNLGIVLHELGHFDEALAYHQKALEAQPNHAEAHWNVAMMWLKRGDFEKGWVEVDWLRRRPGSSLHFLAPPDWDGSPLAGRTLLLYADHGFGDTIQFIRYARLAKAQGARVIVECQRPLLRLLSGCFDIDHLVGQGDPIPPHDGRVQLLTLPYFFRTRMDTIPAEIPYLRADPALVEHWRQKLAALPGFKIGINWQGNPQFRLDKDRSIPLREFASLAAVPGVQLVSLQHGSAAEQLRAVAGAWPVTDLGGRLDEEAGPFMDRAAVMMNLDLVVTSDTALAHLAGALGVPVWVALGKVAYWCWLLEREDTPWYPTMRLFRQERRGDWQVVFQRMAEALQQKHSSCCSRTVGRGLV